MLRVLIVEDEPYERRALVSFIIEAGHKVIGEAATASEAIRLAAQHLPQLAIIDIRLPGGVDGLECTKVIKERIPEISVIVLTAYADFYYAQRALELGVSSYMLKPVSPAEIKAKIADLEQKIIKEETAGKENITALTGQITTPDISGWGKPVAEIKAYIDKHYNEPLRIQDLASRFFISPSYLSRLFRQKVGFSLKQYLQIVRLSAAAKALLNSDASVKAVAVAVGYNDTNYFSISFHKYFGLTPSEYRKKYKHR